MIGLSMWNNTANANVTKPGSARMASMQYESRMSDNDALMWHIEKDPVLRSTIVAVTLFDSTPDRDRLMDKIDRGTRLIPRLRQRVVGNPFSIAPPRWEVDPHFDLRYHVRWLNLGGTGTKRDLLDLAEPMGMQGFDRARPLWETVVVEGLEDGKAGMIQKVHHAITDGVGGMQMMMVLLDLERDPAPTSEPMPPAPEPDTMTPQQELQDALGHVARRNLGILSRVGEQAARAVTSVAADPLGSIVQAREVLASVARTMEPATEPLSPIMRERSLSIHFDTLTFSLSELKAAAKKADGKLNDAFVAGVAGGLRRYHRRHGTDVTSLRMNMPINIRNESNQNLAGNQFAPARFAVPCDIEDPIEAMRAVNALVASQRDEPALDLVAPLSGIFNRLPTSVVTALFGSMLKGIDFTTSNVPGAPIPLYIAGARAEMMIPFGPLAGAAVNVTLVSSMDDVHIGINADRAAVPDLDVLCECIEESFQELLKL